MKYDPIDANLFIQNRKNFIAKMKPSSVAVFTSNDEMPRNGDQCFPFRQSSDFFWLTGIDQEKSFLILAPDCPNPKLREVLLVVETSETMAIWYGKRHTKEEAQKVSGIQNVQWNTGFDAALREVMAFADNAYINTNEYFRFSTDVPVQEMRLANDIKNKFPAHAFCRAAPILSYLRATKSAAEIALMQQAIDITEKAFRRVLAFTKPGVMEYELEAEITHEFIRNRAIGHAYYPIIASGKSACVLHYIENNKECKDGDLILFDFGAEYANYAGDLSRTIPVNGKFTPRQKDVYNACLRVMRKATSMLVVGATIDSYHQEVCKCMEKELIGLGLFTEVDVKNQNPASPLFMKYFMHGTSHYMGLDVHDVGSRYEPLRPGMVFSCEPGIYIPEEGIGIRIENDILITENGPVDLMKNIPVEVEEIERLMKK
ncbi:MAG: aminopeptidase P N-terminal domain-containing protein [Bacteroidota bacterium]